MMIKTKMTVISSLLIGLSAFLITASASATLITVGFDASDITISPGNTFGTDLIASVDSSSSIVSFGLDITFDSSILDPVSAVVNASTFDAGSTVNLTDGLIELSGFVSPLTSPEGVSGSLTIATMTFFAESFGMTNLIPEITMGDPTEGFSHPSPPGGLVPHNEIVLNSGSAKVVPEPATMLLFGVGLAGLGMFRKKFNKV